MPVEVYRLVYPTDPKFWDQFDEELREEIDTELKVARLGEYGAPCYTADMMDETINVLEGGEAAEATVVQVVHGRIFIERTDVIRTCDGRLWVESDKIG